MANPLLVFTTPRLTVRPWREDDAPRLLAIFGDPEVSRWTSTPAPLVELDEARQRIATWSAPIAGHPALGTWAVVERETGLVVGTVLLRPLADSDAVEIGWSLHADAWGRGLATEAARGALEHAFSLGHDEVIAIMWPDNHRSAAVCRRLGMDDLGVVTDPWHGSDEFPTSQMFRARRGG